MSVNDVVSAIVTRNRDSAGVDSVKDRDSAGVDSVSDSDRRK